MVLQMQSLTKMTVALGCHFFFRLALTIVVATICGCGRAQFYGGGKVGAVVGPEAVADTGAHDINSSDDHLELSPSQAEIVLGTFQAFSATLVFINERQEVEKRDVSDQANWSIVEGGNVITLTGPGLYRGVAIGGALVKASYERFESTAGLKVRRAKLLKIHLVDTIDPLLVAATAGVRALGEYEGNAALLDISNLVNWTTSESAVLRLMGDPLIPGKVMGMSAGTAYVKADLNGIGSEALIHVMDIEVSSLEIKPAAVSLPLLATAALQAVAHFKNGAMSDVTNASVWTSDQGGTATVGDGLGTKGLVTGVAVGSAIISAAFRGYSAQSAVTVTGATLSRISITPLIARLNVGAQQQFAAVGIFSDGSKSDLTAKVTWISSIPGRASIANGVKISGLLTAVSPGLLEVTAVLSGKTSDIAQVEIVMALPTATATSTLLVAPTRTLTTTPTTTSTASRTATPTFTYTPTRTNTPSGSATYTPTRTPTTTSTTAPKATSTATNTPTPTSTLTTTPTKANTAVPTRSYTSSPTSTPTQLVTATFTFTATPTKTATRTATSATTSTLTATPTNTATKITTSTPTRMSTSTPTPLPTSTVTRTSTSLPTLTPTKTASPTVTTPLPTRTVAAPKCSNPMPRAPNNGTWPGTATFCEGTLNQSPAGLYCYVPVGPNASEPSCPDWMLCQQNLVNAGGFTFMPEVTDKFPNPWNLYAKQCVFRGKTGCFDSGTSIRMGDGSKELIDNIKAGDFIWNPVRRLAVRVKKTVVGPEARPLIELGFEETIVRLTSSHPVPTTRGIVKASDLVASDNIMDAAGDIHPITVMRTLPVKELQAVWNIELDSSSQAWEDHMIESNGLIMGDLWLQEALETSAGTEVVP